MKRRLVFEDKELLSKILGDLRFFTPSLDALKTAYEGLEIGEFTNEIFKELVNEGTSTVFARHSKSLNDQLDKTGVVNTKLREIVLQGTDGPKVTLRDALTELRSVTPKIPESPVFRTRTELLTLSFISFDGNSFIVSDEDKERLTETYCRDYLNDDRTQLLYAELEVMRDALSKFRALMTDLGLPIDKRFATAGLDKFLYAKDEVVTIIPKSVNNLIQGTANLKAYQKARADKEQEKAAIETERMNKIHAAFDEAEKKGKVIL
jgi:hypothetical protein